MPFMKWDKAFSVHIDSIDQQHKKIINMINELHDRIEKGTTHEFLNEAFLRLSVYTVKHFIYEETLFKQHGYENETEHKKEHDILAEQLMEFYKKFSIQKEDITEELLEFFKNVMFAHITTYDRQYIDYMFNHGIR